MGSTKRTPQAVDLDELYRALDIPKSEWIEMYRDLYWQVFGEDAPEKAWLEDAEKRRQTLFNKSPKKRKQTV